MNCPLHPNTELQAVGSGHLPWCPVGHSLSVPQVRDAPEVPGDRIAAFFGGEVSEA